MHSCHRPVKEMEEYPSLTEVLDSGVLWLKEALDSLSQAGKSISFLGRKKALVLKSNDLSWLKQALYK